MATNNIDKQSFGQAGATFATGKGVDHTGDFCAILIVEDATFSTLTWSELDLTAGDAMTGVSFPAGITIYGQISAFTISAGKVLAYHAA